MTIRLQAIKPKSENRLTGGAVRRDLRDFIEDVQGEMQVYPPQQPTSYRRTGTYGRAWRLQWRSDGEVLLVNPTPYAVYVGGPKKGGAGNRQAKVMAGKGWRSIDDAVARAKKQRGYQALTKNLRNPRK